MSRRKRALAGSDRGGRRLSTGVQLAIVGLVAVTLGLGGAIASRPALTATGLMTTGVASTINPTLYAPTPSSGQVAPVGAGLIEAPAQVVTAKVPQASKISSKLAALPVAGVGTRTAYLVDADTGAVVLNSSGTKQMMPASTMKTLTCLALLQNVPASHTFTTKVVSPAEGSITLVGGGDPLLKATRSTSYPARSSATDLAVLTAKALKSAGTTSVTLSYDASLFAGPAWQATWPSAYHDQVTTISALWFDEGKGPGGVGQASTNPALAAATEFAAMLKGQGIAVSGTPVAVTAAASAHVVASISSLPVGTLVQQTLLHSDNSAAEVLLRQLAIATGHPGSFAGGVEAVHQTLGQLGVWQSGAVMVDGSGLSRSDAVSAEMLTKGIEAAIQQPRLSAVIDGLPVAGATGTLTSRFFATQALPGRGWARVKTGTLTQVSTYAGVTRTRDGATLAFAVMTNGDSNEYNARVWLDEVVGQLTTCGC